MLIKGNSLICCRTNSLSLKINKSFISGISYPATLKLSCLLVHGMFLERKRVTSISKSCVDFVQRYKKIQKLANSH